MLLGISNTFLYSNTPLSNFSGSNIYIELLVIKVYLANEESLLRILPLVNLIYGDDSKFFLFSILSTKVFGSDSSFLSLHPVNKNMHMI